MRVMPELPEVETIRRQLERVLIGSVVEKVEVLSEKSWEGSAKQNLIGMQVVGTRRFGKALVIDMESNKNSKSKTLNSKQIQISKSEVRNRKDSKLSLVIHLKMTGQLIYEEHGLRSREQGVQGESLDEHLKHRLVGGHLLRQDSGQATAGARIVGGHPTQDWIQGLPSSHTRVVIKFKIQNSKIKMTEKQKNKRALLRKASEGQAKEQHTPPRSEGFSQEGNCSPSLLKRGLGGVLYFNDQRKFGWVKVVLTGDVERLKFIQDLGKEPWDLSGEEWFKLLKSSKKPVKVRIMGQDRVAGVGNIYANDACWEARIDPRRPANSLNDSEARKLLDAVKMVLEEGIKYGGATAMDGKYVDMQGLGGKYQEHFRVYQREGKECLRCGEIIKKIALGGRGTFYCEKCQK